MKVPKSLVLLLNSAFVMDSKHYDAPMGENPKYMEWSTAKTMIDNLGCEPIKIEFSGGEPSLSLDLIKQICKYTENRNDITYLVQINGTLITEELIDVIERYNIEVEITLDGISFVNENQKGNTKEILWGLNLLKAHNIDVNLNCIVSKYSIDYLDELLIFSLLLGNISRIGLELLRQNENKNENMGIYYEEPSFEQVLENLIKLKKKSMEIENIFGKKISIREFDEAKAMIDFKLEEGIKYQPFLERSFVVEPDGDIYPCPSLIGNDDYLIGHVRDIDNWRKVKLTSTVNNKCGVCRYKDYCVEVCPPKSMFSSNFETDCNMKKVAFYIAENY